MRYLRKGILVITAFILLACGGGSNDTTGTSNPTNPDNPPPNDSNDSTFVSTSDITTSEDLIDAAVARGDITVAVGLAYKFHTLYDTGLLPAEYQGDGPPLDFDHLFSEASANFDNFTTEEQDALIPFLVPPIYSGSWYELYKKHGTVTALDGIPCNPYRQDCPRSNFWQHVDGDRVRVWYDGILHPEYEDYAIGLKNEVEAKIWPELTAVMQKDPLSDADQALNGGDGRLDIVLVEINRAAEATTMHPLFNCKQTSVTILVDPNKATHPTVAHEFMHALQHSFPSDQSGCYSNIFYMLMESTANWAANYVYPNDPKQWEHQYPHFYLEAPEKSLDSREPKGLAYGAYLFPLFLTDIDNNTSDIIRLLWTNIANKNEFQSIKTTVESNGETLDEVWGRFALNNWNRTPKESYKTIDKLAIGPWPRTMLKTPFTSEITESETPHEVSLEGGTDKLLEIDMHFSADLPYLSTGYYHFKFTDPNIRSVSFFNGFTRKLNNKTLAFPPGSDAVSSSPLTAGQLMGSKIQAFVKITGQPWTGEEDWTDAIYKPYCRDMASENIEEMILILSNGSDKGTEPKQKWGEFGSLLHLSNTGCARWDANVNLSQVDPPGVTMNFKATGSFEYLMDMLDNPNENEDVALFGKAFRLVSGNVTSWTQSGTDNNGCVYNASAEGNLDLVDSNADMIGSNLLYNYTYIKDGTAHRGYTLTGFWRQDQTLSLEGTKTCPDGQNGTTTEPISIPSIPYVSINSGLIQNLFVSDDGSDISGTGNQLIIPRNMTGNFTLTAKSVP